jgi:hypothetical protein
MLVSVVPSGLEGMFFEVGLPVPDGAEAAPPTREEVERQLALGPGYGLVVRL